MRALAWCLTALLPTLAQAEILQFDLNGEIFTNGGLPVSFYQATFLTNTASGGGSLQYGVPYSLSCFSTLNVGVPIYDVNVITSGKTVLKDGTGSFGFGGETGPTCNSMTDEGVSVVASGKGGKNFIVSGVGADIAFSGNPAAVLSSKDPLGLILDGSAYSGFSSGAEFGPATCEVPTLPLGQTPQTAFLVPKQRVWRSPISWRSLPLAASVSCCSGGDVHSA
jgi:hypothetical protein